MLGWREVEESIRQELNKLSEIRSKMQDIRSKKTDQPEAEQLLEENRKKPTIEWARNAELQAQVAKTYGYDSHRLCESLGEMRLTTENYRDYLRNYRREKKSFQNLVSTALSEEGITKEQLSRAFEDWETIKQALVDTPLFDLAVVREFVLLEAIFRIVQFFSLGEESEYEQMKKAINKLISRWDVEDHIQEDDACKKLLILFLLKNKDRFCILGKRDASPKPTLVVAEAIKKKRKGTEEQIIKSRNDVKTLSRVCSKSIQPALIPHSKLTSHDESYFRAAQNDYTANQLRHGSLQNAGVLSTTSGFEQLRQEMREVLYNTIRHEFKEKLAMYYSKKLEGEIFSMYYYSAEVYREKTMQCAKQLSNTMRLDSNSTDMLMTTSLDFEMITAHYKPGKEQSKTAGKGQVSRLLTPGPEVQFPSELLRDLNEDGRSLSPDLGMCETPLAKRRALELALRSDKDDSESFEFLETITKIKEEEIRKLKLLLAHIQKENDVLREAMIQVRSNLLELGSVEEIPHPET
jgi:hypothetical protein